MAENKQEPPAAPEIDMSAIQNAEAANKKGVKIPEVQRTRGSGKFNFVQPEKIQLPSGGRLYENVTEDADILNGFINMFPMTVKEEEILSTQRFLKAGVATRMIIDNCIASSMDAKDILLYDSNFLLFYLRKISYGDEYKFELKCGNSFCEREFDHTVNISELSFEEMDEDIKEPFTIELPYTKYKIEVILPRLFHSEEIYQQGLKRKKGTDSEDQRLVDNLMVTTVSITNPEKEKIDRRDWREFYEAIPGMDSAELRSKTNFSTGVDKMVGVECPYCNQDYSGTIPIGTDFFRF